MGELIVGPLARSILSRHRAGVWALIVRLLERARAERQASETIAYPIVTEGVVLDERELARQNVVDGRWVTLGIVARGSASLFVDVDIVTGDARVVVPTADLSVERRWHALRIPADVLAAMVRADELPTDLGVKNAGAQTSPEVDARPAPRLTGTAGPRTAVGVDQLRDRLLREAARSADLWRMASDLLLWSAENLAEISRPPARRRAIPPATSPLATRSRAVPAIRSDGLEHDPGDSVTPR